ncbi:zinc ABC transporter substrate-binding protein [Rhodosalinus sp. K401]|uniref:zinc ABC transporter substrate-binding protein n=1 Tax=Rhodosalinus sp. K401 TaxID=3239195 RepID=UPI0035265C4C
MFKRLLAAAALGAASSPAALAEPPRVAADIAPVHSLVAQVMQGVGTPSLLMPAGASPHAYALRPSEARALSEAELVVWIGEDLSPQLGRAVGTLAEGAVVLELLEAEETRTLPFRQTVLLGGKPVDGEHDHDAHGHDDHAHEDHGHEEHAHEDHGHDDHAHDEQAHDDHAGAHDHAHDGTDPHAWLDPENAKAWLGLIADALADADPANAEAYAANADAGREAIDAAVSDIEKTLAPVRDRTFVVFHDAYQYFEDRFDLNAAGAIALADATDPGPARLSALRRAIAERGVSCVLAEPQFDPGLVAAVASESELDTAVIDPLGVALEPGPAFYPALLRGMAASMAECL